MAACHFGRMRLDESGSAREVLTPSRDRHPERLARGPTSDQGFGRARSAPVPGPFAVQPGETTASMPADTAEMWYLFTAMQMKNSGSR